MYSRSPSWIAVWCARPWILASHNHAAATAHNYFAYNFIKVYRALRLKSGNGVTDRLWDVADLVALWSLMSGMRKAQGDQAAQKPQRIIFDFAQGKLRYKRQMRRRNRRYRLVAALLILGVVTGVVVALLTNWLSMAR